MDGYGFCFNFYSGFGRASVFMFLVKWIPDPPDQMSIILFLLKNPNPNPYPPNPPTRPPPHLSFSYLKNKISLSLSLSLTLTHLHPQTLAATPHDPITQSPHNLTLTLSVSPFLALALTSWLLGFEFLPGEGEFMKDSKNPGTFQSKKELLEAGEDGFEQRRWRGTRKWQDLSQICHWNPMIGKFSLRSVTAASKFPFYSRSHSRSVVFDDLLV